MCVHTHWSISLFYMPSLRGETPRILHSAAMQSSCCRQISTCLHNKPPLDVIRWSDHFFRITCVMCWLFTATSADKAATRDRYGTIPGDPTRIALSEKNGKKNGRPCVGTIINHFVLSAQILTKNIFKLCEITDILNKYRGKSSHCPVTVCKQHNALIHRSPYVFYRNLKPNVDFIKNGRRSPCR